jgi:hypothetical protein
MTQRQQQETEDPTPWTPPPIAPCRRRPPPAPAAYFRRHLLLVVLDYFRILSRPPHTFIFDQPSVFHFRILMLIVGPPSSVIGLILSLKR